MTELDDRDIPDLIEGRPETRMEGDTIEVIVDAAADLPITQRKPKRSCDAISPAAARHGPEFPHHATPSKRSKRVRFPEGDVPDGRTSSTTGLTPSVRRTGIATPRRRASTPLPTRTLYPANEAQFTPFREVLDDRCRRRIRRNGLSEEMNGYYADRKVMLQLEREIEAKDEELRNMRKQLEAARLTTNKESSQQMHNVEAELATLRKSFSEFEDAQHQHEAEKVSWDDVPTSLGPGSEGGDTIRIWEDEDMSLVLAGSAGDAEAHGPSVRVDPDIMAMAVDLASARTEKTRLFTVSRESRVPKTLLHFADSPIRSQASPMRTPPAIPSDFYQSLSQTLKATTRRAEDAELAVEALEAEIKALGFDGETAGAALRSLVKQFRDARLDLERALPGETVAGFNHASILPEIMTKLRLLVQAVRDRDAELKTMRAQQKTLKGNFDRALVAADKASTKAKELEDALDHSAEEMLDVRMRSQTWEKDCVEKDKTIGSLITALGKYREDVGRLEELISQLEAEQTVTARETATKVADLEVKVSDMEARVAAEETGRRAAETSAVERLAKINELEAALSAARSQFALIEALLASTQSQMNGQSAEQESTVGALNSRISSLSTALASANAEVDKLKILNTKLEDRLKTEIEQGVAAAEAMQAHYLKGFARASEDKKKYLRRTKIREANWDLETDEDVSSSVTGPVTPTSISMVRFADIEMDDHVEGSVEVGRGRKGKGRSGGRRRYDSGIGMDTLSEEDEDVLSIPELSSEGDYGMIE